MDDGIKKRLSIGLGEIILILLTVMEVIEFMGLLTVDLNYIEKVVSWIALGYLIYSLNLTEIFFGYKDKIIDFALIMAYFLLTIKDFLLLFKSSMDEIATANSSFLVPMYSFILDHGFQIQILTFYAGGGLLLLLALSNIFLNADIKAPSIMAMIHGEGPALTAGEKILRALTSFIIYSAFFVVVFNLIIEWLGWAVSSSIVVIGIFFYLFVFVKHFRKFDSESFLHKVGDVGEEFYARFISLFRSKETIMLGISGLLVLHLLTDVGNFIIPYILGKKIDYFVALGVGHTPIPNLLSADLIIANTMAMKAGVILAYAFNIAAALSLFLIPSLIWYEMYNKKRMEIPDFAYGLFFASIFVFIFSPIFRIKKLGLGAEGFYGVDILTNAINADSSIAVAGVAVSLFIILALLCRNAVIKQILRHIAVFMIEAFFAYYIFLYFNDIASFYAASFMLLNNYFVLFYLFIFMAVTVFFYLGGMVYFIYNTFVDMTKKFI